MGGRGLGGQGLDGREVFLGITGGISAYKSAAIVSRLVQAGARVTVAMTRSATEFVQPLTFQALSGRPVVTDSFRPAEFSDPQHISLARRVDLAVVAPCTMDCLARLANGHADDPVTLILSAVDREKTPVLLAPAMNEVMWRQPATTRNVARLREDGYRFIGPDDGWQACRTVGAGRMAEPDAIIAEMTRLVGVGG